MSKPSLRRIVASTSWKALLVACVSSVVGSAVAVAEGPPPVAVPGDLVTDYQGIRVADPYRDLEYLDAPGHRAWIAAQGTAAREALDRLPGLATLQKRVKQLDATQAPIVFSVRTTPRGQWFYMKRLPGGDYSKLYVRASKDARERLLLDPEAWKKATGKTHAINAFTVSPDGRHVAAVISKGDAELGELQIFDVATRRQVGATIPGIWGEAGLAWTADGAAVIYPQGLTSRDPGGLPFGKTQVYEHRVDAAANEPDRKLMGWEAGFGPFVRETDWVFVDATNAPGYTLVTFYNGVSSNARVLFARTADLDRDPRSANWTPFFNENARVGGTAAWGHYLYARTFDDGAPRFRIVRYDLEHPQQPPVEVVPQQDGVIDGFAVDADALYVAVRKGSIMKLLRRAHVGSDAAAPVEVVDLPFEGSIGLFGSNTRVHGMTLVLEGWTRPRAVLRVEGLRAVDAKLAPPAPGHIGEDWQAEETTCTSHDGAQVPMSILSKRGLVRDGSHPTLLNGYGGYGIPEPAFFSRRLDPWLQRGGLFVDVKPRGGGAFGPEWYHAGVGPNKPNTWKDMIACAQALIERGYTSTPKLAIQGYSMGGIAVGRAITERPDLFAAAIVRAGITDSIRYIEATTNGPNHEYEMGSLKTADGVRQLLAMSTYDAIAPNTAYPAVLFTAGMNDNRVAPWQSFKSYARMAAATNSGRPILLRVEGEVGHGVSMTASQSNSEFADRLAFILWNTGDPEFQPPTDR